MADNNKISYFNRSVQTKSIPIIIYCSTQQEGLNTINRLMECTEKDVLSKEYGKIIIGGYYLKCFVIGSKKKSYDISKGLFFADLKIVTDYPAWTKEISYSFEQGGESGKNLDYSYDFPYDFTSPSNVKSLNNIGFAESDFKMIIYGEVTNPVIYVGNNGYSLNCYIASGQYITIDSKEKTIVLTKQDGTKENYFSKRNKTNYIFQKIPSGVNSVNWVGSFIFDIVLYEERSEPKWI